MSAMGFTVSPASLQGPLCNPQKGCDWGWSLELHKGMEPRTL